MSYDYLGNEQSFMEFIDGFERGTLDRAVWTHAAHLAVGSWYVLSFPESEATGKVRIGIRHYNECAGIANTADSGYHETLTLFWLSVIKSFILGAGGGDGKLDMIRRVVEEFGSRRDLFREYYSFDVVASRAARAAWIPPERIVSAGGNKSTLGGI